MAPTKAQRIAVNYILALKERLTKETLASAVKENNEKDDGSQCATNRYVDATGVLCIEIHRECPDIPKETADETDLFYCANQYARISGFDEKAVAEKRMWSIDPASPSEHDKFIRECQKLASEAGNNELAEFLSHEITVRSEVYGR